MDIAIMEDRDRQDDITNCSRSNIHTFPVFNQSNAITALFLHHNHLRSIPDEVSELVNLRILDVSFNLLESVSDGICDLIHLEKFYAKQNRLCDSSLPKDLSKCSSLTVVNLSGNNLQNFPFQLIFVTSLQVLHLGANGISSIPPDVDCLQDLRILYLGGNQLSSLPVSLGNLVNLSSLILADNQIASIPASLARLSKLQSLSLHNNKLTLMPPEIVNLRNLQELSLRGNPLVVRFIRNQIYDTPTLKELAARCVVMHNVNYDSGTIPPILDHYLSLGKYCINPGCQGVYFTSCVKHVRFVDFCGKYRLPLMQYLCSPSCSPLHYSSSESDSLSDDNLPVVSARQMQKVLLG